MATAVNVTVRANVTAKRRLQNQDAASEMRTHFPKDHLTNESINTDQWISEY